MSAHTPTPWEMNNIGEPDDNLRISQWERMDAGKVDIAIIPVGFSDPFESEQHANAAYIVECVNSHDQLLAERDALLAERDAFKEVADEAVAEMVELRATTAKLREALARARAGFETVSALDGEDMAAWGREHCFHEVSAIEDTLEAALPTPSVTK